MKRIALLLGIGAVLGGFALAQDKGATPAKPPPITAEQRKKMADLHEKMAACLRSDRPLSECHDEIMKACQETMGTNNCPMMGGMGPMKQQGPHHGPATTQGEAK